MWSSGVAFCSPVCCHKNFKSQNKAKESSKILGVPSCLKCSEEWSALSCFMGRLLGCVFRFVLCTVLSLPLSFFFFFLIQGII